MMWTAVKHNRLALIVSVPGRFPPHQSNLPLIRQSPSTTECTALVTSFFTLAVCWVFRLFNFLRPKLLRLRRSTLFGFCWAMLWTFGKVMVLVAQNGTRSPNLRKGITDLMPEKLWFQSYCPLPSNQAIALRQRIKLLKWMRLTSTCCDSLP